MLFGPMICAHTGLILVESYVEGLGEVVFDARMASCSLRKGCGRERGRRCRNGVVMAVCDCPAHDQEQNLAERIGYFPRLAAYA